MQDAPCAHTRTVQQGRARLSPPPPARTHDQATAGQITPRLLRDNPPPAARSRRPYVEYSVTLVTNRLRYLSARSLNPYVVVRCADR